MNNIYVSPFLFFVLLVRLNWQVYCRDSFQLPNFPINSVFVILFHFQERKKAQQSSRLSRCYRGSPSLNPLHRVYWIINVFSQYCLAHATNNLSFGNYFICYLKRFIFLHMKLSILLKMPQKTVDLKNTESNITVTDWEFSS